MDRLRVAVLFGGCSEEHPVSVKSAREVAKSLDLVKYEPFYVGITRRGAWKLCHHPDTNWESDGCPSVVLSPDRSAHGLLVLDQGRYESIRLDVVLPVLHGKLGEDGAIQGLLELSGIPYVGCDVQSSALCMDKSLAYTVARDAGIATPTFYVITPDTADTADTAVTPVTPVTPDAPDTPVTPDTPLGSVDPGRLTYPVFVKPARSGSSFGVSKVTCAEELPAAVAGARLYDSKVLIEEAVAGDEIGCAILGNGTDLVAGEPDRISLSHGFFRIHQEQQPESGSENARFIVPADISPETRKRVQATAKDLYRILGCRGLARVDMFLTEDGTVVLNEVNTLPGMTSYSRYPRMMAAAGLTLGDLIDRLVTLALRAT